MSYYTEHIVTSYKKVVNKSRHLQGTVEEQCFFFPMKLIIHNIYATLSNINLIILVYYRLSISNFFFLTSTAILPFEGYMHHKTKKKKLQMM